MSALKWMNLILAMGAVMLPIVLAAQDGGSSAPKPGVPQTDQERKGEALFLKYCPLCHVYSKQKEDVAVLARTQLIGVFHAKRPPTEADVRRFIMEGLPRMMPAFKYQLDSKQIDDIIEYLKIR